MVKLSVQELAKILHDTVVNQPGVSCYGEFDDKAEGEFTRTGIDGTVDFVALAAIVLAMSC